MPSRPFLLCWDGREEVGAELDRVRRRLRDDRLDKAMCPLRYCLESLARVVAPEAPGLAARGGHATLVICTQGRITDREGDAGPAVMRDFTKELSAFSRLPVRIIVRLCTDKEEVRDMFSTLDFIIDSVDVLDDFWGEVRHLFLLLNE